MQVADPRLAIESLVRKLIPAAAKHTTRPDSVAFGAYIDSFREADLLGSLLELSPEVNQLMLRHTTALFGDVLRLQSDLQARLRCRQSTIPRAWSDCSASRAPHCSRLRMAPTSHASATARRAMSWQAASATTCEMKGARMPSWSMQAGVHARALRRPSEKDTITVQPPRLESVRLSLDMMRHLVREATALGALLRDAEARVQSYGLLRRA